MNAPTRGAISPVGAKSWGFFDPSEESIKKTPCHQPNLIVTVGGSINQPGQLVLTPGMTLWQAVQQAGGATESGSMRQVKLIRDGKEKVYDLTKVAYRNEILKPYDTVEVTQKVGS